MMTTALGRAEKTGLRKVSKATNLMDRRIQHARQLFNERIARAESEYHDAMRRAVVAEYETSSDTPDTAADRQEEAHP
jgi:hypothetical protein